MVNEMKVLSLFDGISCGMVALERAGIKTVHAFNINGFIEHKEINNNGK